VRILVYEIGGKRLVSDKAVVKPKRAVRLWVEYVNEECVLVGKLTVCKQMVSPCEHFSESEHRTCTSCKVIHPVVL
jgi:hypothetical protein